MAKMKSRETNSFVALTALLVVGFLLPGLGLSQDRPPLVDQMGWADTILVNGKMVNIPSYSVNDGDVIEVKEKSREVPIVLEASSSTEGHGSFLVETGDDAGCVCKPTHKEDACIHVRE